MIVCFNLIALRSSMSLYFTKIKIQIDVRITLFLYIFWHFWILLLSVVQRRFDDGEKTGRNRKDNDGTISLFCHHPYSSFGHDDVRAYRA